MVIPKSINEDAENTPLYIAFAFRHLRYAGWRLVSTLAQGFPVLVNGHCVYIHHEISVDDVLYQPLFPKGVGIFRRTRKLSNGEYVLESLAEPPSTKTLDMSAENIKRMIQEYVCCGCEWDGCEDGVHGLRNLHLCSSWRIKE